MKLIYKETFNKQSYCLTNCCMKHTTVLHTRTVGDSLMNGIVEMLQKKILLKKKYSVFNSKNL